MCFIPVLILMTIINNFFSVDFLALDKLCKEAIQYYDECNEEEVVELEMYN